MVKTDTRGSVADAVLALLSEDHRLTYEAVASRAGVSRQTVYTHFPTRSSLLLAAVERARAAAGLDVARQSVYEAPTAVDALEALVELHSRWVPSILSAYVAVERERSMDPEVDAAFARRTGSRREIAHHVAIRLNAEGVLAPPWTADTAGELIDTLTSGTFTAQLLRDARWTVAEMRDRMLVVLRRALLLRPDPRSTTPIDNT
jgi:AcrR family transcriptional regulator